MKNKDSLANMVDKMNPIVAKKILYQLADFMDASTSSGIPLDVNFYPEYLKANIIVWGNDWGLCRELWFDLIEFPVIQIFGKLKSRFKPTPNK